MQKKIIALAIAGLASTAAFAQSNVTVYGVADVYAANVGSGSGAAGGQKTTVLNSGGLAGSRLGFKGVEDLGGGTKALFTLEYGLSLDGNAGVGSPEVISGTPNTVATGTQARQQFVGLTGAYGTVIAGRLQSLVYNHNAAYNPTFGSAVDTLNSVSSTNLVGGTRAFAIGTAERLNNAVAYVAPKLGDFTLAGAYTNAATGGETANFTGDTRAYELSGNWAAGAASVGVVYRNLLHTGAAGGNGNNSYAVGASYDLGVAKLMATYGKQQTNKDASNQDKATLFNLGAIVPVSAAGAVILSYANGKVEQAAGAGEIARTSYAALYKHNLSKRTSLYGGFANSTGTDLATGSIAGVTSRADGTVAVALAGVNHSF